jgi:hypothetical protein
MERKNSLPDCTECTVIIPGIPLPGEHIIRGEGIVSDEDVGTVGEDMRVTLAVYFAPTSFEDALRNVFLYEEELVAQDLGSVQEWKGFGPVELDLYYPPRQ